MHRFAVWAPGAKQVDLVTSPGPTRSASRWSGRRAAGGATTVPGPSTAPTTATASTAARSPPTRAAPGSRTASTARAGSSTPSTSSGATTAGAALAAAPASSVPSSTSCTSARSPTRARSTPPSTRLDDLVALGVDLVELMPVAAFEGRWGWGYDGVHPYAVHEPYGGPEALQRFVDAAHQRGLGVALDVVYNHLGPSGNYLARFGPYFTDDHHTPWGQALNLDGEGNLAVRRLDARQRAALVPRLPRRRPAPGRRARAEGRLPHARAGPAGRRDADPVARARAPARPHRRERPQRPADGGVEPGRRHGHGRAVERRPPPRAARGAHR